MSRPISEAQINQITSMYREGIYAAEIAAQLCMNKSSVYRALSRAGVQTQASLNRDLPCGICRHRDRYVAYARTLYCGTFDTVEEAYRARMRVMGGAEPSARQRTRKMKSGLMEAAPAPVDAPHPDRVTINLVRLGGFGDTLTRIPVSVARVRFLERPSA